MYVVDDLKIGGPVIFVTTLTHLDKTKYNISVCCVFGGGELVSEIEQSGIKVFVLGLRKWKPWLVFKLAWLMKKQHIQIVHTHLFGSNLIGRLSAILAGVPVIIATMRSTTQIFSKTQILIDRFLARFSHRIMVIDEPVRESVIRDEKINPDKIICIHNAISIERFNYSRMDVTEQIAELKLNNSYFLVGTVASLSPIKGHIYILRAIPHVLEEIPNVKFIFVGDGPSHQDLEREIQRLNIGNQVFLLGYRKDIPQWLSLFDVFVHPCLIKGIPKSVIEAMVMKKPVVANTFSAIPGVIENNLTALLVPPRDAELLAQAIITLLKNKSLREQMVQKGYERVVEYFNYPRMIKELEAMYDSLVEERLIHK